MPLNNVQIGLLRNFVEKAYTKAQKDYQEFDLEAEIDKSLTYQENKNSLIEKLKQLGIISEVMEKTQRQVKEELEHYTKEQLEKEVAHYKEELDKNLEEIKKNAVDVSEFYGNLPKQLEMVKQGYINSLFVVGDTSTGKTTFVDMSLNGSAVRVSGHISPLRLYELLYENKNNKIIFFDDTEDMLEDRTTITLLKQALDTKDERVIMWQSTKDLGTLPNWFIFGSKIIFAVNTVPNDRGMKAIISRSEKFTADFDYATFLKIMYAIAKKPREVLGKKITPEERTAIVDFIKENSDDTVEDFNLRTQRKIENYYLFDRENWQKLAKDLLSNKVDELKLIKELMMTGKTVEEQVRAFCKATGLSRATYFNYKKSLKSKIK